MPLLEAPDSVFAVATLTTEAELADLHDEWLSLWRRCADATPFESPDWLASWWRHLGAGALHLVTLRRHERLVGVAPLISTTGANGEPVFQFLGTGVSDYGDILAEPGCAAELCAAIGTAAARNGWQADLQQLPPESPLLRPEVLHQLRCEVSRQEPCPRVSLPAVRSGGSTAGWRRKLEYDRRRLRRFAPFTFERAEDRNFDELFAALLRLHGARWAETGGVLADERVRAFHSMAIPALLADEIVRFYALRAGGVIVACYYGFLRGRRASYYLSGFDPEWQRFGIGNLIVAHAMDEAAAEGATSFDFLRGCEPYKYRWGARDEPTFRLQIHGCPR